MPRAAWVQTNFNGGEWTPLAYGRFDIGKYKNGLAECRDFMPTQQGGLTRRPGFRWGSGVKDSTYAPRLQRFEFSTTQAYVLELGHQYVRFYTNDGQLQTSGVAAYNGATAYVVGDLVTSGGVTYYCIKATTGNAPPNATYWYAQTGTIYEIPTPYSSTDVWSLSFAQSADTLYIAHPSYPPMKLQRAGATRWTLSTISFMGGPFLPVNVTGTTLTASAATGTVTVTASSTTGINGGVGFRASDVGRHLRIKAAGIWLSGVIASVTDSTHVQWTVTPPTGSLFGTGATGLANVSGGGVFGVTIVEPGGGYSTPPPITFSGGGGAGALGFAKLTNGAVTSVVMQNIGSGYSTATPPTVIFDNPTLITPTATTFWRLGLWNSTDGYPSCVTFFQDRLCWAGATNTPGRVDCSNVGDYENMAPSNMDGLVTDSSALSFTLNSNTVNAIAWMVPDENGLIIGTTGGEWVIGPSGAQQALTATNVNAKPLSNFGSSSTVPIRVGKATLFIQRTGRKLREVFYQFTYNTFQAVDISLVSEHLTKSGIKQMALHLAPQQIVWMVRNDGALVAMTYDKDQEVLGWHRHPIGGYSDAGHTVEALAESVATIPAPGIQRDEVWVVVKRYINGAVYRSIEVMAKMWEDGDAIEDCVFLDSSAAYDGAPTTTVSGLTWLKGETVGVLTDGAVHPDCVVSNTGTITLSRSASTVQVGFKYKSRFRLLPIEAGGADGPSQGKLKRIHRVVVRFFQSVGVSAGSDSPGVTTYPQPFRSSADPMDGPVGLFTGDKRWSYEGTWDTQGTVFFETDDPLPCNITMLMAQLDTEDAL